MDLADSKIDPSDKEARFNNQWSTMLQRAHLKVREAGDHKKKTDKDDAMGMNGMGWSTQHDWNHGMHQSQTDAGGKSHNSNGWGRFQIST